LSKFIIFLSAQKQLDRQISQITYNSVHADYDFGGTRRANQIARWMALQGGPSLWMLWVVQRGCDHWDSIYREGVHNSWHLRRGHFDKIPAPLPIDNKLERYIYIHYCPCDIYCPFGAQMHSFKKGRYHLPLNHPNVTLVHKTSAKVWWQHQWSKMSMASPSANIYSPVQSLLKI
jgi:hypothetical protein